MDSQKTDFRPILKNFFLEEHNISLSDLDMEAISEIIFTNQKPSERDSMPKSFKHKYFIGWLNATAEPGIMEINKGSMSGVEFSAHLLDAENSGYSVMCFKVPFAQAFGAVRAIDNYIQMSSDGKAARL